MIPVWFFVAVSGVLLALLAITGALAVCMWTNYQKTKSTLDWTAGLYDRCQRDKADLHAQLQEAIRRYIQDVYPDEDFDEDEDDDDDFEIKKVNRLLNNPDAWKGM